MKVQITLDTQLQIAQIRKAFANQTKISMSVQFLGR